MKKIKSSIAIVFLLVSAFAVSSFINNPSAGYKVGDKAANFKLKNVDGKMVSLTDYKNAKGFILTFTCNHCPFSQAYEKRTIDLHNKYNAKGYPVIAINPNDPSIVSDDSYEEMVKRSKEYKYPFAYLLDNTQETARTYGAARTPHVYILQKKGSDFIVKYIGAIDDNTDDAKAVTKHYVDDAVDALIAGKEVAVNFTKAIGCTIKWKKQ